MVFHVLMFGYRKPTLSPQEFQAYYEDVHIPLIKTVAVSTFPLSHTRRYIRRTDEKAGHEWTYPALVLNGAQKDFEYDVLIELCFKDEEAFYAFSEVMSKPAVRKRVEEDCAKFLDESRATAVVIGNVRTTHGS